MSYEKYLEEKEKNPKIRDVKKNSWAVYKCHNWGSFRKTINFLSKEVMFWKSKIWVFKLKESKIKELLSRFAKWEDREKLAKEFWINQRTIYRYLKKYNDNAKKEKNR